MSILIKTAQSLVSYYCSFIELPSPVNDNETCEKHDVQTESNTQKQIHEVPEGCTSLEQWYTAV